MISFYVLREPPPYSNATEYSHHSGLHLDVNTARKSLTGPRGGKPSPVSNVAEMYLNAVESTAEQAHNEVVRRRPKVVESAVKAARVTANSNKRHSGSYSAAPCSKQVSRAAEPAYAEEGFADDASAEKTIRTSPIPVRRSIKKDGKK